jgi:hypothetical protein
MTTPTITCEQFADALADFLERDVTEATRASMERHALGCIPCGELLADLRTLRIDAANLPELAPSRDLWEGIARRIETPVVVLTPGGRVADDTERARRGGGTLRFRKFWIGAAAAALVVSTAVITRSVSRPPIAVVAQPPAQVVAPSKEPAASPNAGTPASAAIASAAPESVGATRTSPPAGKPTASLVANRASPEATYDTEITRLRAILAQRRSTLDTTTIKVIERNLQVIDDAIAQCKAALAKDPASRFLMESLNDALDTKVHLLRTAAMLPART